MWRCVAIDLDGTILRGTTACQVMADAFGHREIIDALEARFASGEITNSAVADGDAAHYEGRLVSEVASAMAGGAFVDDVAAAVEALRSAGIFALLCTVTWEFAAKAVADRFGFDGYCGTRMDVDGDGRLTGVVSRYFEPLNKVTYVSEYCRSRGIPMSSVVAIGDARSDIPLCRAVGFSVAFNGTDEAIRNATAAVTSDSILDALGVVPGLLDQLSEEVSG